MSSQTNLDEEHYAHYWKPISFLLYSSSFMLHEIIQTNRTVEEYKYSQPTLSRKRSVLKNEIIDQEAIVTQRTRESRFCPILLGTSYRDWGFLPVRYDIQNSTAITTYINKSDTLNSIQRRRLFQKLQRQGYNATISWNQKAELEAHLFSNIPTMENAISISWNQKAEHQTDAVSNIPTVENLFLQHLDTEEQGKFSNKKISVAAQVVKNDSSSKCPLIFGDVRHVDMAFRIISPTIVNGTTYSFNSMSKNVSQRKWLLSRLKIRSPDIKVVICEEQPLVTSTTMKLDVKQNLPDSDEKVSSHDILTNQVQPTCPSLMRLLKLKDLGFQTRISYTVKDYIYIVKAARLSSYQESKIQKKLAASNLGLEVITLVEEEPQFVENVKNTYFFHLESWTTAPAFIVKRKHSLKSASGVTMKDNSSIDTSSTCLLPDQIPQCKFLHEASHLTHCYSDNSDNLEKSIRSTAMQYMTEETDDFNDFHILDTVVDFFTIWRRERLARKSDKYKK